MFILSYIAISLWILTSMIALLIFILGLGGSIMGGSGGGMLYSVVGILINGFILYAAYHNILNLNKCGELMSH